MLTRKLLVLCVILPNIICDLVNKFKFNIDLNKQPHLRTAIIDFKLRFYEVIVK